MNFNSESIIKPEQNEEVFVLVFSLYEKDES
jgi:hypothetical protein